MRTLYQHFDFTQQAFIWSYENCTTSDFHGYYHWHRGFEWLIIEEGKGNVVVNQQTYPIKPGMVFFFLPHQLHNVHVRVSESSPYVRTTIHLEPSAIASYLNSFTVLKDLFTRVEKGLIRQQAVSLNESMLEAVRSTCSDFDRYSKFRPSIAANEQLGLFMLRMLTILKNDLIPNEGQKSQQRITVSEKVMDWIETHYMESFELDRLAADLHLSKGYLSRIFREETGTSITGYLTVRRLQQACILLQTSNQSIEIIGEKVGLPNVSYFIKLFKKSMGISPHQYRLKL